MDTDYKSTGEDIEYRHVRYKNLPKSEFHLHDGFEIYFLVSGDIYYLIEKNIYAAEYGNLFVTNSQEMHRICFQSDCVYERITIMFNPTVINLLNTTQYNLLNCLINRPKGEQNRITLTKKQITYLLDTFNKFELLYINPSNSNDVLKLAYLIELLVYINEIYNKKTSNDDSVNVSNKLTKLLNYIDENLDKDLNLEFFETHFYINKFYLCKLFKKSLGCSIYEYIICKRISMAKKLIKDGCSLTEVGGSCGFKDYSSFFRMFKKHIGLSPANYKKMSVE